MYMTLPHIHRLVIWGWLKIIHKHFLAFCSENSSKIGFAVISFSPIIQTGKAYILLSHWRSQSVRSCVLIKCRFCIYLVNSFLSRSSLNKNPIFCLIREMPRLPVQKTRLSLITEKWLKTSSSVFGVLRITHARHISSRHTTLYYTSECIRVLVCIYPGVISQYFWRAAIEIWEFFAGHQI